MKLIYHNNQETGQVSPFDQSLLKVSYKANPLLLASPYIGLNILSRIIEHSIEWKLLSDIEAWLQSGNRRHRARCWEFIVNNLDNIRHVPNLHAKVAIGNGLVFLGSANFTEKGILERTELSILVDEPALVIESLEWFESIWENSQSPVIEEGDELISALDEIKWTTSKSRIKLTTNVHKITSVLSDSNRPKGLDIAATLARAGIAESHQQKSLYEVYKNTSDLWFSEGQVFTFKELLTAISPLIEQPQVRDVWMLIVHETANHWLGGIFSEGYDRYYYNEGFFTPWTPSALYSTTYIDEYLNFLISSIDVKPNKSYLPNEDKWLINQIPAHHILPLIDQLLLAGLIIEVDVAGDIEHYSLDSELEWPKRWNKFVKSRTTFNDKVKSKNIVISDEYLDESEFIESKNSEFVENLYNLREIAKTQRMAKLKMAKNKTKK